MQIIFAMLYISSFVLIEDCESIETIENCSIWSCFPMLSVM